MGYWKVPVWFATRQQRSELGWTLHRERKKWPPKCVLFPQIPCEPIQVTSVCSTEVLSSYQRYCRLHGSLQEADATLQAFYNNLLHQHRQKWNFHYIYSNSWLPVLLTRVDQRSRAIPKCPQSYREHKHSFVLWMRLSIKYLPPNNVMSYHGGIWAHQLCLLVGLLSSIVTNASFKAAAAGMQKKVCLCAVKLAFALRREGAASKSP